MKTSDAQISKFNSPLPGASHWGWGNIGSEKKLAFRPFVSKRPFKGNYHQEVLRWYDYHLKGLTTT